MFKNFKHEILKTCEETLWRRQHEVTGAVDKKKWSKHRTAETELLYFYIVNRLAKKKITGYLEATSFFVR